MMTEDKKLPIYFTISEKEVDAFFDNRPDLHFNKYNENKFFKKEIKKCFEEHVEENPDSKLIFLELKDLYVMAVDLTLENLGENFLPSLKASLYSLWSENFVRTKGISLDISDEMVATISTGIIRMALTDAINTLTNNIT